MKNIGSDCRPCNIILYYYFYFFYRNKNERPSFILILRAGFAKVSMLLLPEERLLYFPNGCKISQRVGQLRKKVDLNLKHVFARVVPRQYRKVTLLQSSEYPGNCVVETTNKFSFCCPLPVTALLPNTVLEFTFITSENSFNSRVVFRWLTAVYEPGHPGSTPGMPKVF